MSLGVDGGEDERGHANYDLHVLGRMKDLGRGVWVFFLSSFFYNSVSGSGDCFMGFVC